MERIKQAVEQASRQRKAKDRKDPPFGQGPDAQSDRSDGSATEKKAAAIEYTHTRCIDVSPAVRENNKLVAAIPGHPLRDTYRMLRTRIIQELEANDWSTIAVTSPLAGCGKSLTAINLAISLAMDMSHTVLLIDADLRHPATHDYFGYQPELGLNDYLYNDAPLDSILFHPNIDRLCILPGREPISESAEALRSPRFVSMMQEIRTRYSDRIVILDVPPVLTLDDALSLGPSVDCMLMVAENGLTTKDSLRKSLELLEGIPIIGTILNKTDKKVEASY